MNYYLFIRLFIIRDEDMRTGAYMYCTWPPFIQHNFITFFSLRHNLFVFQVVLINEQLVVNGFGVVAEQGSCCGTTSEDGGRTDEEATKSERDTE